MSNGKRSVMNHTFSQIPSVSLQRSKFNRSHGHKTTLDAGYLVPIFVDEALPGDTFNLNMTAFARLATPLKPVMDNMFMDYFFFAVPIRLIWDNWQKFNGEQIDPDDSTDFEIPQMVSPAGGYDTGSLSDYFGIPIKIAGITHSALWHRAYNLIYNTWFRDENLIDSVVVDRDDADSDPANYVLLRRGKRHDYFTSCLPWPQKGDAVVLPLGTEAPIKGIGAASDVWPGQNANAIETGATLGRNYARYKTLNNANIDHTFYVEGNPDGIGPDPHIVADLTNATASTINALRQAFQIQRMLERDARGGTRYTEIIRAHFGVISPDARLQRPEYLGGGSNAVNISPIAQTSSSGQTGAVTPQGNLSGFGVGHGRAGFVKSFTEHCVLIGLVSIRADLSYQQGLNRMFSRLTRYDFYWPALAHLGEQAVLNKEIYCVAGQTTDDGVFGYQERYAEYRYKPSLITGKFRSTATGPLDMWHLAQNFSALPELGQTFIEENPPIARVIAVPTEPHFLFDSYFDMICVRPMPVYSVPGLIDHF